MGQTAIGRRSAALVSLEDCYSSWRRRGTQELRDALYVQCPKGKCLARRVLYPAEMLVLLFCTVRKPALARVEKTLHDGAAALTSH